MTIPAKENLTLSCFSKAFKRRMQWMRRFEIKRCWKDKTQYHLEDVITLEYVAKDPSKHSYNKALQVII